VAPPDPTEARFPTVPAAAGHYESFYLKACHPERPLALWIRYTVHKRPGAEPTGSLWFTLFDGDAAGPRAQKSTLPAVGAGGGAWISVGEASMGPGRTSGSIDGVDWELRFEGREPALFHLPSEWMYRTRLPRTKLVSPVPAARFDGSVSVDGRAIAVDAWRGMVGHNWGAQHAERWIWLHGLTESGDWIDAAIAKVRVGPLVTPWVASGAISIGGTRHALGGPGRRPQAREAADRCAFEVSSRKLRVRGEVEAARKDVVGWIYADPDGSEHNTLNCSIADMRLRVEGQELVVRGSAAYELGMREDAHGIPVQPFPDG